MNGQGTEETTNVFHIYNTSIDSQGYHDMFNSIEESLRQLQPSSQVSTESVWAPSLLSFDIQHDLDIFSELEERVFHEFENEQMALFMKKFRKLFYQRINSIETSTVLPKLVYVIDEDNADMIRLASTWNQGSVMLYFSFEKELEDSSYGLIWNDNIKKNYESRTGNIYLNDSDEIIHEVCDFIFRVFA